MTLPKKRRSVWRDVRFGALGGAGIGFTNWAHGWGGGSWWGSTLTLAAACAVFFPVMGLVVRQVRSNSTRPPGFLVAATGVVYLTWPFTVLSVSDAGLELRHRLSQLFPWLLERETVRASWQEVEGIDATPRTLLVTLRAGSRCRYSGWSVAAVDRTVATAAANGVAVRWVRSTLLAAHQSAGRS